jgi:shikimate dehydrogenase
MTTSTHRYAVMGNPIAHSKSPLIHSLFAQQTAQNLHYEPLLVSTETGEFAKAISTFQTEGGQGLNVTVPFKQIAWSLMDQLTPRAQQAGSVNTIWFDQQGKWRGDNTDGIGLVQDLTKNEKLQLAGKRLLILGAGGAVRGILGPLLDENLAKCVIANRTLSKAEELTALFDSHPISACAYSDLTGQQFDLIINGTSTSLQGTLPPLPAGLLATRGGCYDLMYSAQSTPFMQWGILQNAAWTLDGLGMLVEQAAEAFWLWRNCRPDTKTVIAQVRKFLISGSK